MGGMFDLVKAEKHFSDHHNVDINAPDTNDPTSPTLKQLLEKCAKAYVYRHQILARRDGEPIPPVPRSAKQTVILKRVVKFDTSLPREPVINVKKWMSAKKAVQTRLGEMRHPNKSFSDHVADNQPGWRMCHILKTGHGPCESYIQYFNKGTAAETSALHFRCEEDGRHATAHSEYKVGFDRERAQQRFGKDNMDAPSFDLLPGWTFVDDGVGYYKHTNGTVQSKRPRRDLSKQRATG